jgi:14-3-3 protein beta/theta/zeta
LNACNPVRLGFAISFSIFHYEIMKNHKKAIQLAETAIAEALENIDVADEETYRDAKVFIDIMKENL